MRCFITRQRILELAGGGRTSVWIV